MGGAIILKYALPEQQRLAGLIFSAAALKLPVPAPARGFGRFFGTLFPRMALLSLDNEQFSRDPKIVAAMGKDPLIFNETGPARTARELFRTVSANSDEYENLKVPMLILHGEKDEVTSPEGSRELHERAASTEKTLKLYPELVHDLMHEPERAQVMEDVVTWLEARTAATGTSKP